MGMEETCLIEPGKADGCPINSRLETGRSIDQVYDKMNVYMYG